MSPRNDRYSRGFTLIEIMVVVVILGILAAIIVPRLLSRPDEAKVTKAIVDMKGIEESLGLFKLDNGFFPNTEQGLIALVEKPRSGKIPSHYRAPRGNAPSRETRWSRAG